MYSRTWLVSFWKNGFEGKMMVFGTEEELWAYLNSELGCSYKGCTGDYSYKGATDAEIEAAELLRMKVYLCPKIRNR